MVSSTNVQTMTSERPAIHATDSTCVGNTANSSAPPAAINRSSGKQSLGEHEREDDVGGVEDKNRSVKPEGRLAAEGAVEQITHEDERAEIELGDDGWGDEKIAKRLNCAQLLQDERDHPR